MSSVHKVEAPYCDRSLFRVKSVCRLCFVIYIPLSCCCSNDLSNGPLEKSCLSAVLAKLRSVLLLRCTVVT